MLSVALVSGALAVSILDRRYTWLQGTVTRHLPSLPHRTLRRHTAAIVLIAGICTSAVVYKNVVVFGSLAGTPPMSRHIQLINAPRRLAATDGGNFVQPLNLRTMLANYLDPRQFRFEPIFPYFYLQHATSLHVFPETKLDNKEAFASLTAINTIWSLLIVLGLYSLVHHRTFARFQIPVIGAIGGSVPILIIAVITERYLLDVFPLMILAGAVAWSVLLRPVRSSWRSRTAMVAMIALGIYSCCANIAATMTAVRWIN
jgi:hypothetical protein